MTIHEKTAKGILTLAGGLGLLVYSYGSFETEALKPMAYAITTIGILDTAYSLMVYGFYVQDADARRGYIEHEHNNNRQNNRKDIREDNGQDYRRNNSYDNMHDNDDHHKPRTLAERIFSKDDKNYSNH